MRGLWLEAQALRLRDDLPAPAPAPFEALVRVSLAGICNTDLELAQGYYPYAGVPGHEFVGRVEEAPGGPEWVGRRVVGEINAACGACATCRVGRRSHCERRNVLGIVGRDGAFATHLSLPLANLLAVPDELPDEVAVFTEPLAAALEIQEQLPVAPDDRVVVIGAGKLGHLVAQTLALTGCRLQVVGRSPRPLELLAARGIAVATADAIEPRSADLAVECTGQPDGLELARRAVRPRGTIVLKSTYHGPALVDLSRFVVDEITLVGSRCGPFAPALELLAAGRVDPRALLEARYPLSEALAAFEHAARPGALKVLVDC
ncbi:MAG TPA: alcohol dehydrogenase catalytic domain-containing protein [Vicinamibacteria bacterium]